MKIRSSSEVRTHFQEVIDHVHYTKIPLVISKNKKPWVIVQPLPEEDADIEKLISKQKK